MIKQIRSFQTSDNTLHSDRPSALTHQYMLDIRGLIQTNVNGGSTVTPTQVASILSKNAEKIFNLTSKYRDSIRRASKN